MKKNIKTFKFQLENIASRVKKDSVFINKIIKRVSSVIGEFRERCRNMILDFLKNLDLDLRKLLKPLVSSRVVDENVQFPKLNSERSIAESLKSTIEKDEPEFEAEQDENSKLTSHVNMLVSTLEKLAKELLQILHDTNRKYYEIDNPSQLFSEAPTPLAMPLPEYFTFENIENHHAGLPKEVFTSQTIENLKNKVERLLRRGSLNTLEAKSMLEKIDQMILQSSNDLEQVLKDIPNSKREEMVFRIIHSSVRENSHCSPRTERKELEIQTKKIETIEIDKKSVTPMARIENKRIYKSRNSVPIANRQRNSSLPKARSVTRVKKDKESKKEERARTPTKNAKNKRKKKSQARTNKSFL